MSAAGEIAEASGSSIRRWYERLLPRALPQLSGQRFAIFPSIWIVVMIVAVAASLAGVYYQRVDLEQRATPFFKLGLRSAGGTRLGPPFGDVVRASGVVANSRLLAMQGRPVPPESTTAEVATALRATAGNTVRIRTRSPDGVVRDHQLSRGWHHVN